MCCISTVGAFINNSWKHHVTGCFFNQFLVRFPASPPDCIWFYCNCLFFLIFFLNSWSFFLTLFLVACMVLKLRCQLCPLGTAFIQKKRKHTGLPLLTRNMFCFLPSYLFLKILPLFSFLGTFLLQTHPSPSQHRYVRYRLAEKWRSHVGLWTSIPAPVELHTWVHVCGWPRCGTQMWAILAMLDPWPFIAHVLVSKH